MFILLNNEIKINYDMFALCKTEIKIIISNQ